MPGRHGANGPGNAVTVVSTDAQDTSATPGGQLLVDILLATYNGAKYLPAQLDSILAQTHQNFRLLVSDDGSSDATLEILERYRARFGPRLVLLPHPSRGQGVVRNFENLMAASVRDGVAHWIAFADQDDVWLPEKIARTLHALVRLQGADPAVPCLVHGELMVADADLRVVASSFSRYQRMDPGQCSPLSLLSINQVTGCTMMVNRTLLHMALPLPSGTIMHDWWCALLSGSGRRAFLKEPLILYRQHGANQLGAKNRSLGARLRGFFKNGRGVVSRVRALGRATHGQARALQQRLRDLGLDEGYVSEYLVWRERPLLVRMLAYRHYYVGPELDRLSRWLLWSR